MVVVKQACIWAVLVSLTVLWPQQCIGQSLAGSDEEEVAVPPGECRLSFSLPPDAIRNLCRPQELDDLINSLRVQHQNTITANQQLQANLDELRDDYASMVETVERLEKETASWRQIVEWPVFDEKFKPDNMTMVTDDSQTYLDCYDAFAKGRNREGIYTLMPSGAQKPFYAYCDEEGWTLVLRRFDGSTDFYRGWNDYSGGFGELSGEFWLGLEQIHLLTRDVEHDIFIETLGWNNKLYTARHPGFSVGGELSGYQLHIGNMTEGDYQDEFSPLDGLRFTTRDRDNDQWRNNNCADYYNGAWWLQNCGWDPNRRWCSGRGCMTFGEINAKKISMKIRSSHPSAISKRPTPPGKKPKRGGKRPKQGGKRPKSKPSG